MRVKFLLTTGGQNVYNFLVMGISLLKFLIAVDMMAIARGEKTCLPHTI